MAYIAERFPTRPRSPSARAVFDIITKAQESDPALRIHYAAKHASIANAWKKWQGEALGIDRRGTVAAKFDSRRSSDCGASGTSRIRRRSDGPARRVRPDHGRLFRLRNHARNALDAAGSLHPRRTGRRVLRPAPSSPSRRSGAMRSANTAVARRFTARPPTPKAWPVTNRRKPTPTPFSRPYGKAPTAWPCNPQSDCAKRPNEYARPHLVDAGNQVAAQPQQQNPQRTLYYLYKRAARMGPRAGLLSRRQPDAPRGLQLHGRITSTPTANTTNRRRRSTASSPRTIPKFTTTTFRSRCATSTHRRTTAAGAR